jgi:hypothetical protein
MKRTGIVALALIIACGFGVSAAWAGPGCGAHKEAKTASASSCSSMVGEFPTLVMLVGDETFGCPVAAEKAAKAHDAKIVYAVAGEKFDCKDKATEALACASECYIKKFTTVATVVDGRVIFASDKDCKSTCSGKETTVAATSSGCSKSKEMTLAKASGKGCCQSKAAMASAGCCKSKAQTMTQAQIDAEVKNAKVVKYMVVGKTYDCPKEASKARDEALAAIKAVQMKYVVDGREVPSSAEVCQMARKAGKLQYVVGTEKTDCETSARVTLAKAQFEAAKKAAEKKVAAM